jgi:predicted dehydrogenase
MKTINWGVVGLGGIAHKFVADLQTLAGCKLIAVCSSSATRAEAFANQYGASFFTDSLAEMLVISDLDAVYVAAEHVRHHEIVLQCLATGIAVLGEKPFAMNAAQVAEMVEMARSKKVFLMEALWTRFMPTLLQTKEWIAANKIGAIKAIHADFGFKADFLPEKRLYNKTLGGGALLDIGIYPIFLSYVLLGMPQQIEAVASFTETGVDGATTMSFLYENATAALTCTILANTRCEGLIYGEIGSIELHSRWHESTEVSLFENDKPVETMRFPREETRGYEYEIAHVNDCLRKNLTESPIWTLADSENLIALLDGVRTKIGLTY